MQDSDFTRIYSGGNLTGTIATNGENSGTTNPKRCSISMCASGLFLLACGVGAGVFAANFVGSTPPPCPIPCPNCFSYTANDFQTIAQAGQLYTFPFQVQDYCPDGTYPPDWVNGTLNVMFGSHPITNEFLAVGPVIGYPTPEDARQRAVDYVNLEYLPDIGSPLADPTNNVCISRTGEFADGPFGCETPAAYAYSLTNDNDPMPDLVPDSQAVESTSASGSTYPTFTTDLRKNPFLMFAFNRLAGKDPQQEHKPTEKQNETSERRFNKTA